MIAINTGETENRIGLEIIIFPNIIVDEGNIDPEKNHDLNFATVHRKLRNTPRVQTSKNAAQKIKNIKDLNREQTSSKSTHKPNLRKLNLEKQNPERKNERDLYQAGEREEEEEFRFLT